MRCLAEQKEAVAWLRFTTAPAARATRAVTWLASVYKSPAALAAQCQGGLPAAHCRAAGLLVPATWHPIPLRAFCLGQLRPPSTSDPSFCSLGGPHCITTLQEGVCMVMKYVADEVTQYADDIHVRDEGLF